MTDPTTFAHEEQYPWDYDEPNEGDTDRVRWRTLVSGDVMPSSGISFGVCEVPPGAQLAPHHHHPPEVYYVAAGEAEVLMNGEWTPVRQGHVAYHPGDAVHGIRNRGAQMFVLVWAFPTDTFDEIEYFDD